MIAAQRFEILGQETNLPIADFFTAGNSGPLNMPGNDLTQIAKSVNGFINGAYKAGTDLLKEYVLPAQMGNLNTPDQLTASFMKTLNPNVNVTHMVNNDTTNDLYRRMMDEYYKMSNNYGPSTLGNLRYYANNINFCGYDLNSLLDLLNRLGGMFDFLDDWMAQLAALLGLLNRLICAGITNGFSKLVSLVQDPVVQYRAGSGVLLAAAELGQPEVVIDVASTSIASGIKTVSPHIGVIAASTLKNKDLTNLRHNDKFYNDFKNSLDILDPNWRGDEKINGIFSINSGTNFNYLAGNSLKNQFPTINGSISVPKQSDDVNLYVSTRFVTNDPTRSLNDSIRSMLI